MPRGTDSLSKYYCFCELDDPDSIEATSEIYGFIVVTSFCQALQQSFCIFPAGILSVINHKYSDILQKV